MGNKPKYIEEIESLAKENQQAIAEIRAKTIEMEQWQKDMRTDQDKILIRTGEIHTALMGTEYDQSDTEGNAGGLCRRVGRLEKSCDKFNTWKTKTDTRNLIVWSIISAAMMTLWGYVVKKFTGA